MSMIGNSIETEFESGRRWIPVRCSEGELWLNTQWICDSAEEAVESAQHSDLREFGPEWAAQNKLVGVAEVNLEILALLSLETLDMPR